VRLSVSAPCLSLFAVAHCGSITGYAEVIPGDAVRLITFCLLTIRREPNRRRQLCHADTRANALPLRMVPTQSRGRTMPSTRDSRMEECGLVEPCSRPLASAFKLITSSLRGQQRTGKGALHARSRQAAAGASRPQSPGALPQHLDPRIEKHRVISDESKGVDDLTTERIGAKDYFGLPTTRRELSETARKREAYPSVSGASLESRSKLCRRIGTRSRVIEHFFRA
jgi:hypothetical protein